MEYIIYCRKSTDENTERQIQSIPDQIKECIDYAEKNNLTIAPKPKDFSRFETEEDIKKENNDPDQYSRDIYKKTRDLFIIKEPKSAKKPRVRKKRNHLIKLVRDEKVKGIISYHPDRQARNMEDGGILITLVDEGYLDLKYPKFHFEPTATGKMMLGFLFVFSKQYADNISESVTRGNESSIARGKAIGTKKYGYYINDEGYHVPDGKNFDILQEAFHMKIYEDKTNYEIGQRLISRGFTRKSKKGETEKIDYHNFSRILWKDPFYYGLYIHGNAQTDLRVTNPYYKPLITEDEYIMLLEKTSKDARDNQKETRDKNEIINPIPKGLLTSVNGKFLTHDFPNVGRHMKNLAKLQKNKPDATLVDVVSPSQIGYKSDKEKDISGKKLRITYDAIENTICSVLEKLSITDQHYLEYKEFLQTEYLRRQKLKGTQLHSVENQRKLLQGKLDEFIAKNLGNQRTVAEEKVYQNKLLEKQATIDSLDREIIVLKQDERNTVAEITAFAQVFQQAAPRFKKLNYVRKREFTKLIISNITITPKRQIQITLFPHIQALLNTTSSKYKKDSRKGISFGADDETRTRNQLLGRQGL